MTHDEEVRAEREASDADAGGAPGAPRPFDQLPRRSRGPLIFGIVAATLQMAALLWLVRCS